jgi:hypothetical protein
LSFRGGPIAVEDFKKLMEFTDQVHRVERYGADGILTTCEMGKTRVGSWRVEDDQLCVDLGKEGGRGCYEVHFWANDDAVKPAKGLRAALDKMANAKSWTRGLPRSEAHQSSHREKNKTVERP